MLNSAGFYIVLLMGWAVYAIVVVWRVPRNVCLGAVVPEEKRNDPKCRRLERCYYWGVTLSAIVFIFLIRTEQTQLRNLNYDGLGMGLLVLIYSLFMFLYFLYLRTHVPFFLRHYFSAKAFGFLSFTSFFQFSFCVRICFSGW